LWKGPRRDFEEMCRRIKAPELARRVAKLSPPGS
jgi:hypothetical protein